MVTFLVTKKIFCEPG